MQNLLNAYSEGSPAQVKAEISKWEIELKAKATEESIQAEEWEPLVVDPGNTRGRLTLFK